MVLRAQPPPFPHKNGKNSAVTRGVSPMRRRGFYYRMHLNIKRRQGELTTCVAGICRMILKRSTTREHSGSLSLCNARVSPPDCAFFFFFLLLLLRPFLLRFLFVSSPLIFPTTRFSLLFLLFLFFFHVRGEEEEDPGGQDFSLYVGGNSRRESERERDRGKSSAGMIRVNKDKSNSGGTGEKSEIKCSLTPRRIRKKRFLFFNRRGETRAATHPCGNESRETANIEFHQAAPFLPLLFSSPRFGGLVLSPSKQVYTIKKEKHSKFSFLHVGSL